MAEAEEIRVLKIAKTALLCAHGQAARDLYYAFCLAIDALKKQEPEKVKREFRTSGGTITCFETDVCPRCGKDFFSAESGQAEYCSFCPDCGQALEWSEEAEC